jgi:hypothetical protein
MNLVEALEQWRSNDLKPYVVLLGGDSRITRKADRINFISQALLNKPSLRYLWQQMDEVTQRAISVAFHNGGAFDSTAFVAQYGSLPPRPKKKGRTNSWSSYYSKEPILFDVFVIRSQIPDDLMALLADLVLAPERFQLDGADQTPTEIDLGRRVDDVVAVETEAIGRTDLLTYLQLMDRKQLRFSDKNKRLTAASVRKVLANLMAGDFREESDKVTARTTIRPTGLDVFTQEAGLATRTGKLTKAGRTYLRTQDPQIMLDAFEKWTTSGKFDELHRIKNLGGLKSRGTRLTPAADRREKVIEALSWCPVGRWIDIRDFYRAIIIWDFDFKVEKTSYSHLYVGTPYYGDLNSSGNYWGLTTGLYINALIWEYLGTFGVVDVAFLEDEYRSLLDADFFMDEPISLYDGLTHFRITPWGAFLLGQADEYVPPKPKQKALFTVDGDRRVHLLTTLTPGERLQLEAIANPSGEDSYQLDEMTLLTAVESGQQLDALIDFLRNGHQGELPPAILDWLKQLRKKQGAFKQVDTAVLIQLKQPGLMEMVNQDKPLAKVCQPVGEETILVRSSHLTRFRKRLKSMGYLLG